MAKKKARRRSRSITPKGKVQPIKNKMTKTQLIVHLAKIVGEEDPPSRTTRLMVRDTLDALSDTISRSIMPGSAEVFMIPRLLKISIRTRPAIKKGTMVRSPATGEKVPSKGRPASKRVRIAALAGLKRAAAGEM